MPEHSIAVRRTLAKDGIELPSLGAAKKHVIQAAFAVLARDIEQGRLSLDRHIDLEDETGKILYTVRLRNLFEGEGLPN